MKKIASTLALVLASSASAAEVCTLTQFGARLMVSCSNVRTGFKEQINEELTAVLKEKLTDGFKITHHVAAPYGTSGAIFTSYTLVKP